MTSTELRRFFQEMGSLRERRITSQRRIAAHPVRIPINGVLPVEILRRIFIACVAAQSGDGSLAVHLNFVLETGSDVRLALCHVSSRWRAVVIQTRELWNDVRVLFEYDQTTGQMLNSRRIFALFDVWLSLGDTCPLHLTMLATQTHPRIVQTLVRCKHRIRSLKFYPRRPESLGSIIRLPPYSLEHLEKIAIDCHVASLVHKTPVFIGATRLRCVTLRGSVNLASLTILWQQLTELDIEHVHVPMMKLYPILAVCVHLIRAGLLISGTESASRRILLPTLHFLKLQSRILDDAAPFLVENSFPSLNELVLNCDAFSHPRDPMPVIPFIHPSALVLPEPIPPPFLSTVRRLSITGSWRSPYGGSRPWLPGYSTPVPRSWLAACNLAEEVFIPHSPLGDALAILISEGALFPNLRLLVIPEQDFHRAVPMLRARLSSHQFSTTTELGLSGRFWWMGGPDADVQPKTVEELMAAGVFICDEMVSEGFEDPVAPCCGQIEDRARECRRAGVGLFAVVHEREYSEGDEEDEYEEYASEGDHDSGASGEEDCDEAYDSEGDED
ncbi:hypothetical protein FB45DRAFT_1006336 [Roridomyces roridus]|uniref:F-box domain-containing protein n=1 Tax=Roridomyces roridus TaxID=1738132 RepID=A0AAD7BIZ4_9AGAR|nr:hypothetical protein FB45DRAFT_1006336 [Roridomyces roridus]